MFSSVLVAMVVPVHSGRDISPSLVRQIARDTAGPAGGACAPDGSAAVVAGTVLLAVATAASVIPAWRARGVNPMEALQIE